MSPPVGADPDPDTSTPPDSPPAAPAVTAATQPPSPTKTPAIATSASEPTTPAEPSSFSSSPSLTRGATTATASASAYGLQAPSATATAPGPSVTQTESKMSRRGLMEQDLSKLDVTQLHPLSPEVISRQATINIGTIGHVAHGKSTVVKAISGVQGHDILMATMLNGAAIMDGALLLIAANESCPQPQTSEHLAAVEIMRLQHIIILQNKIDLIQESAAMNQHEAIQKFIQGTIAQGAPVVPISAQLKYNIDVICEYIVKKIPIPERNFTSPPNMIVIRSFDVNKPGSEVNDIKGGVAGGSILKGVLRVNQKIEVRPGIVMKEESGRIKCTPIYTRIVSLYAEQNELQFAIPGGLIGVGTTMDPTLTRADRLVGELLPPPEATGREAVRTSGTERASRVSKLAKGEILMLNIGSMSTGAKVVAVKNDLAKPALTAPVCTNKLEKLALSRRIEKHWRLIGWGTIQAGITLDVPPCPL
ncbi:unnamed protein product [Miscanthus lutarioriparius]|uniref:protein-synthesizing GTPase n=1 Tax=Miscanthus lutarioriparius TaxID=422564 RepID=A0A811QPE6_9POAL|nr:unnamed protein product [Miscanthus lutarioriparius]